MAMTDSKGVIKQEEGRALLAPPCPDDRHVMYSVQTGSTDIPYVEICRECGWVDPYALVRTANNIKKRTLTDRAARIAVAADIEPFAFVQQPDVVLSITEILVQALGAASVCWKDREALGEFDPSRAQSIFNALYDEVDREVQLTRDRALLDAEHRVLAYMRLHFSQGTIDEISRLITKEVMHAQEGLAAAGSADGGRSGGDSRSR
jgi:hypothetical protein